MSVLFLCRDIDCNVHILDFCMGKALLDQQHHQLSSVIEKYHVVGSNGTLAYNIIMSGQ